MDLAGGTTEQADLSQVNLALRVQDEDHFHIPRLGENLDAEGANGGDGLLDLNQASAAELATLPGIGPVKAQAIVDYRQEHGPFQRMEDLLLVSGIGSTTLEEVRDLVAVR